MSPKVTPRTRGRKWMAIIKAVRQREPRCAECLRHGRARLFDQVDHIEPLHKGGTDDMDNLEGLCTECHEIKTARDMGHKPKAKIGVDGWPV